MSATDRAREVRYRYTLERVLNPLHPEPTVLFVMLNPSTADEREDDPTIRRCIGFARSWGAGRLRVVNLFAARATDPREMKAMDDPVGPGNDQWIAHEIANAETVVAAWGTHGAYRDRAADVMAMLPGVDWQCLGTTKDGHPRHPLYVAANTPLRAFLAQLDRATGGVS